MAASAIARGATVSIVSVAGFDALPADTATDVIYSTVVTACEAKGIKLSDYGNHATYTSLKPVADYEAKLKARSLFDVAAVQEAFGLIGTYMQSRSTYKRDSYGLKHAVERSMSKGYLSNGDLICAMLLHGYAARFGKRGEAASVNCEFKAVWQKPGK